MKGSNRRKVKVPVPAKHQVVMLTHDTADALEVAQVLDRFGAIGEALVESAKAVGELPDDATVEQQVEASAGVYGQLMRWLIDECYGGDISKLHSDIEALRTFSTSAADSGVNAAAPRVEAEPQTRLRVTGADITGARRNGKGGH